MAKTTRGARFRLYSQYYRALAVAIRTTGILSRYATGFPRSLCSWPANVCLYCLEGGHHSTHFRRLVRFCPNPIPGNRILYRILSHEHVEAICNNELLRARLDWRTVYVSPSSHVGGGNVR